MNETDQLRLARYLEDGLSCREAAAVLGVSPATAIRWTKRCGLTSRRSRRLKPETRAAVIAALDTGASPAEAAARCGVSISAAARLQDPQQLRERREALRRRLLAALRAGQSLRDAAAETGVSVSTAGRWAREAGLPPSPTRRRARRDDEARALSAMEAGMSAEEAAATFDLTQTVIDRLARRPRLAPERLARRKRLFAALATGLSCRKAAAQLGLPVATAIRWARRRDEGEKTEPGM